LVGGIWQNDDTTRGVIGFTKVSYKYKAFGGILLGTKQGGKEMKFEIGNVPQRKEKSTEE